MVFLPPAGVISDVGPADNVGEVDGVLVCPGVSVQPAIRIPSASTDNKASRATNPCFIVPQWLPGLLNLALSAIFFIVILPTPLPVLS
jgi:hypothetical protein